MVFQHRKSFTPMVTNSTYREVGDLAVMGTANIFPYLMILLGRHFIAALLIRMAISTSMIVATSLLESLRKGVAQVPGLNL